MPKPFLMLSSRADPVPAASEAEALPRIAGLRQGEWVQVKMEQVGFPEIDLNDWSGIIVCGSPFDVGTPEEEKSAIQRNIEAGLRNIYPRILDESFPYLGLCYGLGTLNLYLGGEMGTDGGEAISAPLLTVNDAGRNDELLKGMPRTFHSYVGHHEAVTRLGEGMEVLVTGEICPIHMVRVGDKAWATQFHPELDLAGIEVRIDEYGGRYYPAEEADAIREVVRSVDVTPCHSVLTTFVELHRR